MIVVTGPRIDPASLPADLHVRHRLERYRAGRCMEYQHTRPADIAAAIASEIGRHIDYLPVATDGAARAAALLAELL
jgi:hypothetical protein